MKREWKPGDVALIPFSNRDEVGIFIAGGWVTRDTLKPLPFEDARPLVVIDPEDREQARKLIAAVHHDQYPTMNDLPPSPRNVDAMQAALREFANPTPPKPPEPTDPTARVTDRRDNIWRLLADGDWVCTSGPDCGEYLTWDRLASERGPVEVETP